FERRVAEPERLLGGRGYLPNKEFRQLYLSGRITEQDLREAMASSKPHDEKKTIAVAADRVLLAQDVQLVHLLYGVEALDPCRFPGKFNALTPPRSGRRGSRLAFLFSEVPA